MCSIVYSSYLSINSEVKDSRKKNTKTEKIKHILHFPHVSKKHQLASPLLAEAGGDVCPMSGQAQVRHIEPSHLSGLKKTKMVVSILLGLSPSPVFSHPCSSVIYNFSIIIYNYLKLLFEIKQQFTGTA